MGFNCLPVTKYRPGIAPDQAADHFPVTSSPQEIISCRESLSFGGFRAVNGLLHIGLSVPFPKFHPGRRSLLLGSGSYPKILSHSGIAPIDPRHPLPETLTRLESSLLLDLGFDPEILVPSGIAPVGS